MFLLPFDISSGRGIAHFNIKILNLDGEIVADFSQGRVEGMENIAQVIIDSLFPGIRISNLKRAYFTDQAADDISDEILQEIKGSSDETTRYDVPLYQALPNGRTRKTVYVIELLQTSTTELSLNYFVKGTGGRDEKSCRVLEIAVNGDEVQYKCEDITLVRRIYDGGPDDLELRKN